MPFVLDASVTGAWLMPDETDPRAEAVLAQLKDDYAVVPELWWVEIRNLLILNERRKRITSAETDEALKILDTLDIEIDHDPSSELVLSLTRRHGLTVYDATYLALAKRDSIGLATFDKQLIKAAPDENIPLLAQIF